MTKTLQMTGTIFSVVTFFNVGLLDYIGGTLLFIFKKLVCDLFRLDHVV